jgi:hypothetical protein
MPNETANRPDDHSDDHPWAVVELHVTTPMHEQSPEGLADWFEWQDQLSARRADAVRKLSDAGWELKAPAVRAFDEKDRAPHFNRAGVGRLVLDEDDDAYLDIDIRWRKQFSAPEEAEAELATLRLHDGSDNYDLGWREDEDGQVEWWDGVAGS